MKKEQELMRALMRAAAAARRGHPGGGCRGTGGYGHLLDLLNQNGPMSQQQLAEAAGVRPQSVSEALGVMAERGLVAREACPSDRRQSVIRITEEGETHAETLREQRAAHAEEYFSVLAEDEMDTLMGLLTRLAAERSMP